MKQKYQLGLAHTYPFMVRQQSLGAGEASLSQDKTEVQEFVREKLQAVGSQVLQALRVPRLAAVWGRTEGMWAKHNKATALL